MADIMAMFGAPLESDKSLAPLVPLVASSAPSAPTHGFTVAADENEPTARSSRPALSAPLQVACDENEVRPPAAPAAAAKPLSIFCDENDAGAQPDENAENAAPQGYMVPPHTAAAAACAEHGQPRAVLGAVPGMVLEPLE